MTVTSRNGSYAICSGHAERVPRQPDIVTGQVHQVSTPVAIDASRVTAWLCEHVGGLRPPLRYLLVAGGRSNLTYRVEDAEGRAIVLRRPPVSHVLPTAHDMAREYRIIRALASTEVPVPRALGLCEDEGVNGAAFYAMSFVDGLVLRDAGAGQADFSDLSARRATGEQLVDVLASLHAVDVDAVGLGDLAKREGYVERQLRRWSAQFEQTKGAGVVAPGAVEAVGAALAGRIPPQRRMGIVHGDFRLDNAVILPDGSVAAVLDWELCTLGDPMADVGTFLVYWTPPDEGAPILGRTPASTLEGFLKGPALLERYATTSGADVSDVTFFMAFGYWRLACILQGVYARYRAGARGGEPEGVEELPSTVARLASLATATLQAS